MNTTVYLVIIVILIAMSAFCSCIETAFSCANSIRLKKFADTGSKKAKVALYIINNYDKALTAILILNNIVNLGCSSLATVVCLELFGDYGAAISTGATTLLVLTFGEVIPKCLGKEKSDSISMAVARILKVIITILTPFILVFSAIKTLALKLFRVKQEDSTVTEDELKIIVESIEEQGVLEEQESQMVRSALDFDEKTAEEILTPRVDVTAIDIDEDTNTITEIIRTQRYSRIPVYKGSVDNIVGILHSWDYMDQIIKGTTPDLKKLIIKPEFIFRTQKLSAILANFRKKKLHIAIVTDEYGGTLGILTMEDLLEEIVGEIWDEDEEAEQDFIKLSDNTYTVSGDMELEDMLSLFEKKLSDIDCDSLTVGGFVFDTLGTVPQEGEQFTRDGLELTVLTVQDQRIHSVIVKAVELETEE
ncbi:MAG: HlyC/CorC family transporter [Clostridia bacterium]|nr:HlyC/CorC family transporter [Clostridia bacterium]